MQGDVIDTTFSLPKADEGMVVCVGDIESILSMLSGKPPTTDCRLVDTMVTNRCSTRKERDLVHMKGFCAVCVLSSFYIVLKIKRTASG